jgi:hypothetical protein
MRADLLAVKLNGEFVRAGKSTPIDAPQIVSRLIFSMISELQGAA